MPFLPPQLTINGWLRLDAVARALRLVRPRTILEIGTGEGALGTWLSARFDYVGVEPDDGSRAIAKQRLGGKTGRLVADLGDLNGRTFDLVCAFEVLEHMEDDASAAKEWRSLVVPGGSLLVSVPADPRRYGAWDERVGHLRRYDRVTLARVLRRAGWPVVDIWSYGAGLGHVLEAMRNIAARHQPGDEATLAERTAASGRTLQNEKSDPRKRELDHRRALSHCTASARRP